MPGATVEGRRRRSDNRSSGSRNHVVAAAGPNLLGSPGIKKWDLSRQRDLRRNRLQASWDRLLACKEDQRWQKQGPVLVDADKVNDATYVAGNPQSLFGIVVSLLEFTQIRDGDSQCRDRVPESQESYGDLVTVDSLAVDLPQDASGSRATTETEDGQFIGLMVIVGDPPVRFVHPLLRL